ncbi:MAG: hypothetical protein AAGC63_14950 [Propionicimonas sp.]|nr:hypothetical protein [Propionicimonas sp.]
MEEAESPRWWAWLWKAPLCVVAAGLLTVGGFVWMGHEDSMREQYELYLIDTEPHVMAVFDSLEEGYRGRVEHAWVRLQWADEYKELSQHFGVGKLVPGEYLMVVVDPEWTDLAVQVYAREYLAEKFTRYPEMLDEQEMVAYQLSRPLTWGVGFGLGSFALIVVAARDWLFSRVPKRELGNTSGRGHRRMGIAGRADGREIPLGVIALVGAGIVGWLSFVFCDHHTIWSAAAAACWITSLSSMGIFFLRRDRSPVLSSVTQYGVLVSSLVLVVWFQVRPEDLVGERLPSVEAVRFASGIFGVAVIAGFVVLIRKNRALKRVAANPGAGPRFRLTRRGYDPAGVDALLIEIAALPDTPDGDRAKRDLIAKAQFHLARESGYNPVEVDDHLDKLMADRD